MAGHIAHNEMDMHADTCCAGANWVLLELTGDVCKVTPFIDFYDPIHEIPLARCGTMWTDPMTMQEYLLVRDQMLWFGNLLPNSLINPNQLHAYRINVYDDPFDSLNVFGVARDTAFIPFDTTGTIMHFESRVPNEWEMKHFPVILLTGNVWNLSKEIIQHENQGKEFMEMWTIWSLTSRISKWMICSVSTHSEYHGETNITLGQILDVYDVRDFCERLISSVNIMTAYHADLDAWEEQWKVSSIISNNRHSKVTPEEISRKWNIGLQTAKDTLQVTTQRSI